jgi:hypothetical protein
MAGRLDFLAQHGWQTMTTIMINVVLLIHIFLLFLSLWVTDFDCPICQCEGTVVKLKCEQELAREKKDFEVNFKKGKEKAEQDGGKEPRKTGPPLMTYACACHTMHTLCGDVTSTACMECKVRG